MFICVYSILITCMFILDVVCILTMMHSLPIDNNELVIPFMFYCIVQGNLENNHTTMLKILISFILLNRVQKLSKLFKSMTPIMINQCIDKDCVTRVLKLIHEEQEKVLYALLNYVKEDNLEKEVLAEAKNILNESTIKRVKKWYARKSKL